MAMLSAKVGEMEFDGLVSDTTPNTEVRAGTIRKLGTATTLKRGTVLAKSSGTAGDGKLVILGTTAESDETLTPDCILCDDVEVGTSEDVTVAVYTAGCFDPNKVIVKSDTTLTDTHKDTLRKYGIVFKAALAAN